MSAPEYPPIPAERQQHIQSEPWAGALGIEYLELRQGYCRLALPLQPHMLNFRGGVHGGVVFSLADTAFGAACNSYGPPAVAMMVTISYLSAAKPGSRLLATARERKHGRRAGFYDVTVTGEDGRLLALLQCLAHLAGPESGTANQS